MSFLKYVDRYRKIDRLIHMQCTGSPREFASKLGISESHLYFCLKELKDYGLPIAYSQYKMSYYYRERVKLRINVFIEDLSEGETISILGGKSKKGKFFTPLLYNQSGFV
jgi:hypothetical protein